MKEWYLMDNYAPNVTSGYESDALSQFAQDNFSDVLKTTFSDTVLLYNQDLSKSKKIRCVIQGNSADTYLKSMERIGLFPIGTVKAGMYIFFENRYWLITGYPGSNKAYEKATMRLCQYKLRWQISTGDIIERWISAQSSSKYDDGLNEGENLTLTSDSIMLFLPNDDESLTLDGKRVFIDKKTPPDKVYLVSRADSILYDYGEDHGGILCFITEKGETKNHFDRPDLRICDYVEPSNSDIIDENTQPKPNKVVGMVKGSRNIKVGFSRSYVAELTDENGNHVEWMDDYKWDTECEGAISVEVDKDKITLLVTDEALIGKTIHLSVLSGENVLIAEFQVTIVELM